MVDFLSPNVTQAEHDSWLALYSGLQSQVRKWVYAAHLPGWRGQENEIVDDIVGETIARTYERTKLAEEGKAAPIISILHFSRATARNLFVDFVRKGRRMVCFSQLDPALQAESTGKGSRTDIEEEVTDTLFIESLFTLLAKEIILFPRRQKLALLIDLASRACFGSIATLLQQAFLRVGVQLEDYKDLRPIDRVERQKLASLSCIAYRRLTHLPSVRTYIASV